MASTAYRFGEFRLDPAVRELRRGDEEVVLPRKVFDVILYLVEHGDRAVEREELFHAVWGEVELSERVLPQTILEARRALGDSADEPRYIKTVRGYGYHWVAPVETAESSGASVGAGSEQIDALGAKRSVRHRPAWAWMLVALLAVAALAGGTIYLRRSHDPADPRPAAAPIGAGEIALLLPVAVEADERFAWFRLGLMDLMAQRLRAAGQPMVPSDSVIALLRDHGPEPGPDGLQRLTVSSGARLVLGAQAEAIGGRWRVSLRSLWGTQPPLIALGEAKDVIEAARIAADRMALSLGRTPAPEPNTEPGLAMLLQQTEAAMLAQQHDVARALIEDADPELRQHPKIRLQMSRIAVYGYDIETARTILEALLQEPSVERDSALRANALLGMGWVHMYSQNLDAAEAALKEAAHLLAQGDVPPLLGRIRSTLGIVALDRDDIESARTHFAHARLALEGTGDAIGLKALDSNLGLLEVRRERYAAALPYLVSALEQAEAMHDLAGELGELANILHVHLGLLDPQAASAVESRLDDLVAQVDNPLSTIHAKLAKVCLLLALGEHEAADRLLAEIVSITEAEEDLPRLQMDALLLRAQKATRLGDSVQAARLAARVVDHVPSDYASLGEERGRAWLLLVRARLASGQDEAAREATSAMADWAQRRNALPPKIYAALAGAEVAASLGHAEIAQTAFEEALAIADSSQVPLRLLEVAQSYVPWLLTDGPRGGSNPERALVVANRVTPYADRHYGAALLDLRVTHALGQPTAWRAALTRATSLAGERQIPPDLQVVPGPVVRRAKLDR